mmetsp:Transcript_19610/g.25421  ORF Transcript_19610/g.25421 Transcript_19610/m.25421 type:complete len:494 (-) Transcript_19610:194-1675(-)
MNEIPGEGLFSDDQLSESILRTLDIGSNDFSLGTGSDYVEFEPDNKLWSTFTEKFGEKDKSFIIRDKDTASNLEAIRRDCANAASRKYRSKRKHERKELEARNLELECEQASFRQKIGDLQNEIQALKHSKVDVGRIDLKTENMLLRAEVKRHKTFVHHIHAMMHNFPKYKFTKEEKTELLRDGVESITGQVLGMCYTSIADKSWNYVEYFPTVKHLKGTKVVCRWQYLPFGSSKETATRLNLRTDTYNMPEKTAKVLKRTLPSPKSFHQNYLEVCKSMGNVQSVDSLDLKEVAMHENDSHSGELSSDTDLTVLQIAENSSSETLSDSSSVSSASMKMQEYILLHSETVKDVDPSGFPDDLVFLHKDGETTATTKDSFKAKIFVTALAPAKLESCIQTGSISTNSIDASGDEPQFSGMLVRQTTRGETVWTGINSFPLIGKKTPWMARPCDLPACRRYVSCSESPQGYIPEPLESGCFAMSSLVETIINQENQ